MIEIIPAILVKTEGEFHERLSKVESLVSWVQLDVVDGKFAPNVTWGDAAVIAALNTRVRFEIDLMVNDNASTVEQWLAAVPQVGRIFVHLESAGLNALKILSMIRSRGVEAGMSLNPGTPVEALFPFAERLDAVLFLGVEPGFGGQALLEPVYEKVRIFHARVPAIPITVDGGVTAENARKLVAAGASRLAVGSFLFQHRNGPEDAIGELRRAAANA